MYGHFLGDKWTVCDDIYNNFVVWIFLLFGLQSSFISLSWLQAVFHIGLSMFLPLLKLLPFRFCKPINAQLTFSSLLSPLNAFRFYLPQIRTPNVSNEVSENLWFSISATPIEIKKCEIMDNGKRKIQCRMGHCQATFSMEVWYMPNRVCQLQGTLLPKSTPRMQAHCWNLL